MHIYTQKLLDLKCHPQKPTDLRSPLKTQVSVNCCEYVNKASQKKKRGVHMCTCYIQIPRHQDGRL